MTSECGAAAICDVNGTQLTTRQMLGACYAFPATVILANELEWHMHVGGGARRRDEQLVQGGSGGAGSDANGHVTFPAGQVGHQPARGTEQRLREPPAVPPGGPDGPVPHQPRARTATPNLERRAFGGQDWPTGGTARGRSSRAASRTCRSSTRTARGWHDEPGDDQLRRELRRAYRRAVRHARPPGARSGSRRGRPAAATLAGETNSAVGSAVRGQLVDRGRPAPGGGRPRDVPRRPVGGPARLPARRRHARPEWAG